MSLVSTEIYTLLFDLVQHKIAFFQRYTEWDLAIAKFYFLMLIRVDKFMKHKKKLFLNKIFVRLRFYLSWILTEILINIII